MSYLQILIIYTVLFFISISSVYSYVKCDEISSCDEGYICCLEYTGYYVCCNLNTRCCDQGRRCCSKTFLNEINLIEKSTPSFHITKTNNKTSINKVDY